jgi:hypothetical protein
MTETPTSTPTHALTFPVPETLLVDLLTTAAEGGANYWATISVAPGQRGSDYTAVHVQEHDTHLDGVPKLDRIVTALDLLVGLERLAACPEAGGTMPRAVALKHLVDALDDHDAGTADVVMQMTVFGEVIYG